MNAKYTPGLWQAREHEGFWYAGPAVLEGSDDGCIEADARLIAAAPELLEAAKFVILYARVHGGLNATVKQLMFDKAQAAIVKAEGKGA